MKNPLELSYFLLILIYYYVVNVCSSYFTNIFPIISGTVVTIEGPRFSSRAESFMFRSWKADVINMTTVPEVVLAKELGAYFILNDLETDYQNL